MGPWVLVKVARVEGGAGGGWLSVLCSGLWLSVLCSGPSRGVPVGAEKWGCVGRVLKQRTSSNV